MRVIRENGDTVRLPSGDINPKSEYVLGIDIAGGIGADSTVLIVLEKPFGSDHIFIVWMEESNEIKIPQLIGRVKYINRLFNFRKIFIDYTGLGTGPVELLQESLGGRVEGIKFTTQSKIDIYSNLYILLNTKQLRIPDHKKLVYQLKDMRQDTSTSVLKIHHSDRGHDDYPDALALAAWYFRPIKNHQYFVA